MYQHTYYTEEKGRSFWITVYWNDPLDAFFAEVLDVTDQPEDLSLWVEEPPIAWTGNVRTAEEFAECLRPFGGIPGELLDMLREDRHACLALPRGR